MTFWKKAKQTAIVNRLVEEKIYEQVLMEIESGIRRDGLWAKALQESRGDTQEAQGYYIKFRVQSIKDETELAQTLLDVRAGEQKAPKAVKSPNFFTYRNITVYRREKTWWVGNKSFPSQEEAKKFIDDGHL